MGRQDWLAVAARRWGLAVIECEGWQTRGSSTFNPRGTVAHHTAGPSSTDRDMQSLPILINGRGGANPLPGPLCNYGLGRSGTVYVVAAGRANHAGAGGWKGLSGNSSVVGIEAENDGYQPWPEAQVLAYRRLCAAICEALGVSAEFTCRHHEWRAEKPDPHDVVGSFGRAQIALLLAQGPGGGPTPPEEDEVPSYIVSNARHGLWLVDGNEIFRRKVSETKAAGYQFFGMARHEVDDNWFTDTAPLDATVRPNYVVSNATNGLWMVDAASLWRRRITQQEADVHAFFGGAVFPVGDDWFTNPPEDAASEGGGGGTGGLISPADVQRIAEAVADEGHRRSES